MKRIFTIAIAFTIFIVSTGCMNVKYNFAYEYEDLRDNLKRAELIYLDNELYVFEIHWPSNIENFDHTVVGVFAEEDFDDLIKSIVDLPFRYEFLYIIASVSAIYSIDEYVIALYYEDDSRILIGKTAEHRKDTARWLGQNQTGRYVKDKVWSDFIDYTLAYNFDPTY